MTVAALTSAQVAVSVAVARYVRARGDAAVARAAEQLIGLGVTPRDVDAARRLADPGAFLAEHVRGFRLLQATGSTVEMDVGEPADAYADLSMEDAVASLWREGWSAAVWARQPNTARWAHPEELWKADMFLAGYEAFGATYSLDRKTNRRRAA